MAAGACDVLRERHGQDYVSQITKIRPAKTLKEHLVNFFTGRMFPVNKK